MLESVNKYPIHLSDAGRQELAEIIKSRNRPVGQIRRAYILLKTADG
jgi:hypothetical protein